MSFCSESESSYTTRLDTGTEIAADQYEPGNDCNGLQQAFGSCDPINKELLPMNSNSTQRLALAEKENLLELLLRQYILHEVDHHPRPQTRPQKLMKVRTLAHDMPDIYKCLHQGTFGYWDHFPSPEYFRKHSADDYYSVEASDSEPVLETVTPDKSILRVNLRPFKARFPGEEDKAFFMLEDLVLESSRIEKGSPETLFEALMAFRELNRQGALIIDNRRFMIPLPRVETFFRELKQVLMQMSTLPLFSHSPEYHRLNRPAYVIADLAPLKRSPLAFLLDQPIG